MKNGVSINQHVNPETRQTLLHNAVLNQNVNLAQWLMHRAIDVNAVDAHGHTALDLAVRLAAMFGLPASATLLADAQEAVAGISGVNMPPIPGGAAEIQAKPTSLACKLERRV